MGNNAQPSPMDCVRFYIKKNLQNAFQENVIILAWRLHASLIIFLIGHDRNSQNQHTASRCCQRDFIGLMRGIDIIQRHFRREHQLATAKSNKSRSC